MTAKRVEDSRLLSCTAACNKLVHAGMAAARAGDVRVLFAKGSVAQNIDAMQPRSLKLTYWRCIFLRPPPLQHS
ncbi:MAG: hypothetical protein WA280_00155 [Xanthobacteraceae bacterium]